MRLYQLIIRQYTIFIQFNLSFFLDQKKPSCSSTATIASTLPSTTATTLSSTMATTLKNTTVIIDTIIPETMTSKKTTKINTLSESVTTSAPTIMPTLTVEKLITTSANKVTTSDETSQIQIKKNNNTGPSTAAPITSKSIVTVTTTADDSDTTVLLFPDDDSLDNQKTVTAQEADTSPVLQVTNKVKTEVTTTISKATIINSDTISEVQTKRPIEISSNKGTTTTEDSDTTVLLFPDDDNVDNQKTVTAQEADTLPVLQVTNKVKTEATTTMSEAAIINSDTTAKFHNTNQNIEINTSEGVATTNSADAEAEQTTVLLADFDWLGKDEVTVPSPTTIETRKTTQPNSVNSENQANIEEKQKKEKRGYRQFF